jgi:hypothetical protein
VCFLLLNGVELICDFELTIPFCLLSGNGNA